MSKQMIRETMNMLRKEIDSDADLKLQLVEEGLDRVVSLLRAYQLAKARKMTILGGYMLLQLALRLHRELPEQNRDALTRRILDGDYVTGLYFRFLTRYNEYRLLAYLSPVHKRIQLGMSEGKPVEQATAELIGRLRHYLDEQYGKRGDDHHEQDQAP